ncbi:MAG: RsmE family RNA methyltransferase [Chloroflexota bacterium]
MLHSFFVDPGTVQEGRVEIRGKTAHQIAKVLRLQPGEVIDLLDNSGFVYPARIATVSKSSVWVEVIERRPGETEPKVELVLYQALLKGQKFDWVLQKGTEIGVSHFVPVLSERCVSRPSTSDIQRKVKRWAEIAKEAAEQSKRAVIPQVATMLSFDDACKEAGGMELSIMAWEEESTSRGFRALLREPGILEGRREGGLHPQPLPHGKRGMRDGPHPRPLPHMERGDTQNSELRTQNSEPSSGRRTQDSGLRTQDSGLDTQHSADQPSRVRVALLVGPEGGFSEREALIAKQAGVTLVSLGPRILRAETAALVATTVLLYEMGDLGG